LESCFHKCQVSFLVVKTAKCKRGIRFKCQGGSDGPRGAKKILVVVRAPLILSPTGLIHIKIGQIQRPFGQVSKSIKKLSKFEIIRALNVGEDFFHRDHPNPMRKKRKMLVHLEIFWFEHSGRYSSCPPKLLCSPTAMPVSLNSSLSKKSRFVIAEQQTILSYYDDDHPFILSWLA